MNWLDAVVNLSAIGAELREIRVQLTRLADHAEGKTPPAPPLPPAPDEVELAAPHTDAYYAQIESIENRYLATSGRLPTEEELTRELEEGEIGEDETVPALIKRGRTPV